MRRAAGRRTRDEAGFSLVELVITVALMAGVTAIAAAIFVAGLRGDKQVHTTTQATIQAQSIAQGIEKSVRNARRITITSGPTLKAWTTLSGTSRCQQWSLNGSGANAVAAFTKSSNTITGPGTNWAGSAAIKGATLAMTEQPGGRVEVSYTVTIPSETRPVKVVGTVRSRTLKDTATVAGPATCGL